MDAPIIDEIINKTAEGAAWQRDVLAAFREVAEEAIENEDVDGMKKNLIAALVLVDRLGERFTELWADLVTMLVCGDLQIVKREGA